MTKRMLIDASHTEETRVVVLDGNRLEEFDLEAANRLPLKGNIYLAKVVRVEPSLQAAFVEYGGNRHGFLAFSEIHPDYYMIPVADRQRLLDMQAAEAREEEEHEEREAALADALAEAEARGEAPPPPEDAEAVAPEAAAEPAPPEAEPAQPEAVPAIAAESAEPAEPLPAGEGDQPELAPLANGHAPEGMTEAEAEAEAYAAEEDEEEAPPPETLGGEGTEDVSRERRIPPRFLRHYKIQEVIRRRQIMLIQVVKEERGTKGAALTTYVSLAGRFSVLMPNSPRGGGVSRKITSATDRRRLREVIDELSLPQGMSLIVRTAGAQRPKPEIRRDCEYLLRLWDSIRERTFASSAPALIYEEADLIKRSIRDVYARDVEEILVDGEQAYQDAREFMRMLMPQHARKIQFFRDGGLFARQGVEAQLDAMHNPNVQLRSGGYIVINQTEALVAIDVNSGRSTRERHIEDTALRTNLEAADEIARQLRLRDLAGLIVIDFIDMESSKHDAMVERRVKEALRHDRARIQVGRISHFGLLEMSRQRLRPSLTETTFVTCQHCQGRGQVRSLESSALQVLRGIEEEGAKRRAAEICVHVASPVALYLLNRKRDKLAAIEARFGMAVLFEPDESLAGPAFRLERTRAADPNRPVEATPAALRMDYAPVPEPEEIAAAEEPEEPAAEDPAEGEAAPRTEAAPTAEGERTADGRRRRRRRRRKPGSPRADGQPATEDGAEGEDDQEGDEEEGTDSAAEAEAPMAAEEAPAAAAVPAPAPEAGRERDGRDRDGRDRDGRGRRGRGRGPRPDAEAPPPRAPEMPRYSGPTPADPFAGQVDEILAAMEAAEAAAEAAVSNRRGRPVPPAVTEAPLTEVAPVNAGPVAEAPVLEAPAAEASVAEAPAVGAPVADASVAEAPMVEASVVEPPVAETPVAETPVVVAPVIEAPAEAPAAEAPAAAPPVVEAPAAPVVAAEPAAPEVIVGAPVLPVSVDTLGESAPRKRGWWRK